MHAGAEKVRALPSLSGPRLPGASRAACAVHDCAIPRRNPGMVTRGVILLAATVRPAWDGAELNGLR